MQTLDVVPARVIHETVDDEVIILNLDNGMYYSARKVGAEIWNLLLGRLSPDAIVETLVHRYRSGRDATEAAVRSFLQELSAESLVLEPPALAASAPGGDSAAAMQMASGLPFSWPRLDRHSDLKRFLLLYNV